MLFVIHSQNSSFVEEELRRVKKKFDTLEHIEHFAKDISPAKLLDITSTYDIFQNPPHIVVRFDKTVEPEPYYEISTKIFKTSPTTFVFPYDLTQTHPFIKNVSKVKFEVRTMQSASFPKVFGFVDSVFQQNRDPAYKQLNQLLLEGTDQFYILSMVLYGLRNIYFAKFQSPEFFALKDYSRNKALTQSKKYTEDVVLELFNYLYTIDKKVKTGIYSVEVGLSLVLEKILSYTKSNVTI